MTVFDDVLLPITLASAVAVVVATIATAHLFHARGMTLGWRSPMTYLAAKALVYVVFSVLYAILLLAGAADVPREWFRPAFIALVLADVALMTALVVNGMAGARRRTTD